MIQTQAILKIKTVNSSQVDEILQLILSFDIVIVSMNSHRTGGGPLCDLITYIVLNRENVNYHKFNDRIIDMEQKRNDKDRYMIERL